MGTQFNVLVGIFALVMVVLFGLAFMAAPTYQAGDPRDPGFSKQTAVPSR
jgi:hypothetical protein